MAELDRSTGVRLLVRSLAIQGSWNYATMLGVGIAFTLLPVLRRARGDDPADLAAAIRRHTGFFNAHPYLASVAVGALARLEVEGAPPETIDRFKRALISPLGALGDRLVWARWRPFCALSASLAFVVGAPWWVACLLFLGMYNVGHLALRIWGLRFGWRNGRDVGRALLASPLRRVPDRLTIPLAAVGGLLLPPLVVGAAGGAGTPDVPVIFVAFGLAAIGFWKPLTAGRLAALGIVIGSLALAVLGETLW